MGSSRAEQTWWRIQRAKKFYDPGVKLIALHRYTLSVEISQQLEERSGAMRAATTRISGEHIYLYLGRS